MSSNSSEEQYSKHDFSLLWILLPLRVEITHLAFLTHLVPSHVFLTLWHIFPYKTLSFLSMDVGPIVIEQKYVLIDAYIQVPARLNSV